MITLRLSIDDVNTLVGALEVARDNAHAHSIDVAHVEAIMEGVKAAAEKDVSSWDGYVINEVNSVLESLLPHADSGNIGIKYDKPVKETYETGPVYDETRAKGASINIVLSFPGPVLLKQ